MQEMLLKLIFKIQGTFDQFVEGGRFYFSKFLDVLTGKMIAESKQSRRFLSICRPTYFKENTCSIWDWCKNGLDTTLSLGVQSIGQWKSETQSELFIFHNPGCAESIEVAGKEYTAGVSGDEQSLEEAWEWEMQCPAYWWPSWTWIQWYRSQCPWKESCQGCPVLHCRR